MSKNDGGPAYPSLRETGESAGRGMSLRDWFAGQALSGILASERDAGAPDLAREAYLYADAMLAAREEAP